MIRVSTIDLSGIAPLAAGAVFALLGARIPLAGSRRTTVGVSRDPGRARRTLRRWRRPVGAGVALLAVFALVGPLLTIAGVAAGLVVVRSRPWRTERRRRADIERTLPDVLDLLTVTIRAGLTPRQAVETIADSATGPCVPAFSEVVRRTRRGQSFADAVTALTDDLGVRAGTIADAIASCDRYGLPLAPLLDQLSAEARSARQRLAQAEARKLPVRMSFPLVTCTLPSFVLLAIAPAVIAALSSLGNDAW